MATVLALGTAFLPPATVAALAPVTPKPAWAPIAVSAPTNLPPTQSEIQRVGVNAEGGTLTLSFGGATTAPLAFDIPASGGAGATASLQNALGALPTVAGVGGSVSVSGGPGGRNSDHPYFVTFAGSLADTDVEQLSVDGGALSGGNPSVVVTTATQGGPGRGEIVVYAQNVGGLASSGTITVEDHLPPGLAVDGLPTGEGWECPAPGPSVVVCTTERPVAPGSVASSINIPVRVGAASSGLVSNLVTVSGGGASSPATYDESVRISATPAKPGIQAVATGTYEIDGTPSIQAGSHPHISTSALFLNTALSVQGELVPVGEAKTIAIDMPPGFLGNPTAIPVCPGETEIKRCQLDTQVGIVQPVTGGLGGRLEIGPLHSVEAPFGYSSNLAFSVTNLPVNVVASLRSDEDHGITNEALSTPQISTIYGTFLTLWGVPADPAHDDLRCESPETSEGCAPGAAIQTAFLTQPTGCALQAAQPPTVGLSLDTWQAAGEFDRWQVPIPPVTGCERLSFGADFSLAADVAGADSPAAFEARLTVPTEGLTDPAKLATPEMRRAVVELPAGVGLNVSAAAGLEVCSAAQIGLRGTGFPAPNRIRFDKTPSRCPDAAKVGAVELRTALVSGPLRGSLYLAAQDGGNPFGSLLALYLVVEDPETGIVIKLPAEVALDEGGQMAIALDDLPQIPLTSLKLDLKGGSRSLLATPGTCGEFAATATTIPWSAPESGPPSIDEDSVTVDSGAGGAACANAPWQRPFGLGLRAGSANTRAGAPAPFASQITRPDGAQELDSLEIAAPPGLAASLRGIPYCAPEQIERARGRTGGAEREDPSCPAASRVGTMEIAAGAGPSPFRVKGDLHLAGPYRGAPFSAVAIVPALAGPLDLGNVVVRSALHVDPDSAQISVKTDPIPKLLEGIPLRVREVRIDLDRPGMTFNPTSCEAKRVEVRASGSSGAVANLGNRFQVGDCGALAFRPRLRLGFSDAGRNGHPALTATVTQGAGQAGIASASVTLPRSELLAQAHIRSVCTKLQFAADACPARSIYGQAEVRTPLLGQALAGPVYLRSSDSRLPDLVARLRGPDRQPIEIHLAGRIDSARGGIRASFGAIPDVPLSRFVLRMRGGKKGLLVNSRNLCARPARATVSFIAHNGKRAGHSAPLRARCGKQREKTSTRASGG